MYLFYYFQIPLSKFYVQLNEIERRRHMTDEERREDDKRLDALKPKREKPSKYKFMQKYYHKVIYSVCLYVLSFTAIFFFLN
jgi:hypothetical protein